MLQVKTIAKRGKMAALTLATAPTAQKNRTLHEVVKLIKKHGDLIQRENKKDIVNAKKKRLDSHIVDRLTLKDTYIKEMLIGLRDMIDWPDPVGHVIERRKTIRGIPLKKVGAPLGVIGVIYESRPNLSIDTPALCLKSGNACILKGGSEALNSNRILVKLFRQALKRAKLPEDSVQIMDTTDRVKVRELLRQHEYVDVIIPRGGYGLIKTVIENTTIPMLYHADGLDSIYVDASADLKKAIPIIINSKVQRPTVCNAVDTILIHKKVAQKVLPDLIMTLKKHDVTIKGDDKTRQIVQVARAQKKDYDTEFLSLACVIKVVENIDEAIEHINIHGSRHTEGIIAKDKKALEIFAEGVDAAAIMQNCSTRLHDGYVFGLGAEMGINTGKLHARGPVGIDELTTYKWIAKGKGEIRK